MSKIMRILITHANTPYFNSKERKIFEHRFLGLIENLETLGVTCGIRSTDPFIQKVSKNLSAKLDNERPIQELVSEYDAAISTPSTALLPFLERHIPVMLVVIRSGPPMMRSAYMSFCEHDDKEELLKLYDDRFLKINPRLEMQNKVFKNEYVFETRPEKTFQIEPLVEVDDRFKQFNQSISTSIYIFGILEMFLSSLKTLLRRKRF